MTKSISLKVAKKYGEKVLHIVREFKVYDEDLKIKNDESFIFIPLKERPSDELFNMLSNEDENIVIKETDFKKSARARSKSLVQLLEGKLKPEILDELPKSIDIIGDIAVIETSPSIEKYKKEIGEGLLKTNINLKTVLSKAGPISTKYRIRNYKFVAGINKTDTEHKEFGSRYFIDLEKAYFSPRLSFEHERVASQVREGETIVDMFSGVGPFTILAAKKNTKIKIYAIDINSYAVQFLLKNIKLNKIEKKVTAIFGEAKDIGLRHFQKSANRIIMNIPQESGKFVGVACKMLKQEGGLIHYYTFMDDSSSMRKEIRRLRGLISSADRDIEDILHSKKVKNIAPYTWQIVIDVRIA